MPEEIKSTLNSGNGCYYLFQDLFSSNVVSNKVFRTSFMLFVYECGTWPLILREEQGQRVFKNRVPRSIFVPK
jgi:hypothetical protein